MRRVVSNRFLKRGVATSSGRAQYWGFWMTSVLSMLFFVVWQALPLVLLGLTLRMEHPNASWQVIGRLLSQTVQNSGAHMTLVLQLSVLSAVVCLPLLWLMVRLRRGASWVDYMAWRAVGFWRVLGWSLGCLLLVFGLGVLHRMMGWPESKFMSQLAFTQSVGWLVVAVVLVPPVIEELLFRGFLFQGWAQRLGQGPAVLLSGAVFGAIHLQYNAYEMLQVLALGGLLSWARARTGSVWTPMAMHFVNNGVAAVLLLAAQKSI